MSFHFCNHWNTLQGLTLRLFLQLLLKDEVSSCCPLSPGIFCLPRNCSGPGPYLAWERLASDSQGFTVCNWMKGKAYSSLWSFLIPWCWHNLVERAACPFSGLSPLTNVLTETHTHFKWTAWTPLKNTQEALFEELSQGWEWSGSDPRWSLVAKLSTMEGQSPLLWDVPFMLSESID